MVLLIGIALTIETILIILLKETEIHQFWILAFWAINLLIVGVYILKRILKDLKFDLKNYLKSILPGLLITLVIALLPRLFLLGIYPHVSIGDSLKDAGYHALHLAQDNSVEIFGFGTSEGYGNFVALSAYPFLPIFGQTFMTYMFPAMIYGALSVVLLYIILAKYKGQKFAVLASAVFSVSLTQLVYSRTSVCIIADTFLALLIFIAYLLSQKHKLGYLILGLAGGLSWHFYASARIVLLCCLLVVAFIEIKKHWKLIIKKKIVIVLKRILSIMGLFFIGWFIAVGPTLIYLDAKSFFASTGNHPILFNDGTFLAQNPVEQITTVADLFQKGLFAYTFTPANTWLDFFYPVANLMFPFNWFFWIGIGFVIFKLKDKFNNSVLAIVLIYTFFSQVVVNRTGDQHHLQAIVPFINIIAFTGFWYLLKLLIKDKEIRNAILIGFTVLFYIIQINIFFDKRIIDMQFEKLPLLNYQFQFMLEDIAKDEVDKNYYILDGNPYSLRWLGYEDKIEYMTSPNEVEIVKNDSFISELDKAITNKTKGKFLYFKSSKTIETTFEDRLGAPQIAVYKCNQEYIGKLWDCPNGYEEYNYYYYEIK